MTVRHILRHIVIKFQNMRDNLSEKLLPMNPFQEAIGISASPRQGSGQRMTWDPGNKGFNTRD